MLETIVKRDGTEEAFNAVKLNKWTEWSSEEVRDRVDWSSVVMKATRSCGKKVGSQELMDELIKQCVRMKSWPYSLMAGRLYNSVIRKKMYPFANWDMLLVEKFLSKNGMPTVAMLHFELQERGLMMDMGYSHEEYEEIEKMIDHTRDMHMPYFSIKQIVNKYGLSDRVKGTRFETPQFVFMRMAMHLAQPENDIGKRLDEIKAYYDEFSKCRVNAPTPNYTNLGTGHNGFSSCCLYTVKDTAASLAAGDHIAYVMTYMSSGIGSHIASRSLGDPVRNGAIRHQGKLPYFDSLASATKANLQGGRGGACTTYVSAFDPEIETILMLQNPRTPVDVQNRKIHFAIQINKLLAKKASLDQQVFLFNAYTAPDLHEAMFSGDTDAFEALYNKYEQDPNFPKKYLWARHIVNMLGEQREEVATLYDIQIDEVNRHTAYKDPIYSSNLCMEIVQPTGAYDSVADLYKTGDISRINYEYVGAHGAKGLVCSAEDVFHTQRGKVYGLYLKKDDQIFTPGFDKEPIGTVGKLISKYNPEVSTCNLGGIVITNVDSDEEYAEAAYRCLKMIDRCIHLSHYELPHVGYTAKNRLNAGVGIIGLAHHLARKGLKYDTQEGLEEIHRVSERHAYFVISASLRLGKELGNAPWMWKTKWPEGWLPIDTYKKTVDQIVNIPYRYDWEKLRAEIIANGGIRNSSLLADMPTESSSKASGAPNGYYPVRDLNLKKTDADNALDWVAPDNDILEEQYQLAWDISPIDMLKAYAVKQKFTDQTISADTYRNRVKNPTVTSGELLEEHRTMIKFGVKTRYYANSYTVESNKLIVSSSEQEQTAIPEMAKELVAMGEDDSHLTAEQRLDKYLAQSMEGTSENSRGCASGVCTL